MPQDCSATPDPLCLHRLKQLEVATQGLADKIDELDRYLRNGRIGRIETRVVALEERVKAVQAEQVEVEKAARGLQSSFTKLTLLVAGGGSVGGAAAAIIVKVFGG